MPEPKLTPIQHRVLSLMSTGTSATAAARAAGIHRNTIGNWLRSSDFRDSLAEARRSQTLAFRAQTASLSTHANAALESILADPQIPADVRLQAALALRCRPSTTAPAPPARPGRNQPCPCGSGRKFKHCCISKY
ncbi:MAG: SEC-C metal-binding domain-containing protein [Bryobacteraceae bacterium]